MTDQTTQHFAWIGQQVVQEQLAQQQAADEQRERRPGQSQEARIWQIQSDRRTNEIIRQRDQARQRAADQQAQRKKSREVEAREHAEQLEADLKEEERQRYLAAGNLPSGFEEYFRARKPALIQERVSAYEQRLRRGPAAGAF